MGKVLIESPRSCVCRGPWRDKDGFHTLLAKKRRGTITKKLLFSKNRRRRKDAHRTIRQHAFVSVPAVVERSGTAAFIEPPKAFDLRVCGGRTGLNHRAEFGLRQGF